MRLELADHAATSRFGAAIADRLRPGDVVALSGGLGAGKTTLARAILAALGHAGEVPSPSFAIVEPYDPPDVRLPVAHADFFRLTRPAEATELGLEAYRADGVLIAEWPERAGGFAHEPACLSVALAIADENAGDARIAIVDAGPDWLGRMPCR